MDDMNKEFDKENITLKASLTFRSTGDKLEEYLLLYWLIWLIFSTILVTYHLE